MAGPAIMIFSAVLFALFGFEQLPPHLNFDPVFTLADGTTQYVFFYDLCGWTLKVGAIGFALAAMLCMVNRRGANVLYDLLGLGVGVALLVAAVLDWQDQLFMLPVSWVLLLVLAAWNIMVSIAGLRAMSRRPQAA